MQRYSNQETNRKNDETKSWLFAKINKIEKPIRQAKKKEDANYY